jgi:SAM-dependent methyltransferase
MSGDTKVVRGYFDKLAHGWSDRYIHRGDYRERYKVFNAGIEKVLNRSRVETVLEIGCGAHSMFNHQGRSWIDYYATDISHEMLKKNTAPACFFQADFFRLPLQASFDMVILSSVLEWLDEPIAVPRIVSGLVKTGGSLLVSYPNNRSLVRLLERHVIRRAKHSLYRSHYTALQAAADYSALADEFKRQRFELEDIAYFGKKLIFNGKYSSSLRLDVYVKT